MGRALPRRRKTERVLIESDFKEVLNTAGFASFEIIKRWYDDAVALIRKP
jgi:hypothetical protein